MTWRTSEGERWLAAAEGQFEHLSVAKKYHVLYEVAQELLFQTAEIPLQTAVKEGAIYYVYSWLEQEFKDDIEVAEDVWGQKISSLHAEFPPEDDDDDLDTTYWPTMGCMDSEKWVNAIEYLADRVLWDRDYEMYDTFDALPPEQSTGLMGKMTIDSDYFQPWDKRAIPRARERLFSLLQSYNSAA